jgi:hypothetical protein
MNNALLLAQTFPEMESRAKSRIRELKESIKAWDPFLEAVMLSNMPEIDPINSARTKTFWTKVWKSYLRNSPDYKELVELQDYIKYLKKPDYMPTDLASIKQIPINSLFQDKLIKYGNVFKGRCPFHSEKTPSFYIYTKTNTFHCFGCSANGDVIAFYMKLHDCSFIDTINKLGGGNGSGRQES